MTTVLPATRTAREIADLAVRALHDEADLTPKPGLVDRRGQGAHADMSLAMLHDSAEALHGCLEQCALAGEAVPVGLELRTTIGAIGRAGERTMLATTGGVNTHRGALWALGLISTALGAGATDIAETLHTAAALARIPDPVRDSRAPTSHGAHVRRRYGVAGARGEAEAGFPHVTRYAMPAVHAGQAHLALLTLIAHLNDTCVLHRGGTPGLAAVQRAAHAVVSAGGVETAEGRRHYDVLERLCIDRRLSPGGSGDLLSVALLLHSLSERSTSPCRP
jgi:triphosphoribosyl-dephospho-CoA synthase